MNPSLLLAAALCAVLAGSASAAVVKGGENSGEGEAKGGPPKFDFTVRPEIKEIKARPARDASKKMTVQEARDLSDALFAGYQNVGSVSRYRFHVRTKDEPVMTEADVAWAEAELAKSVGAADKLIAEAQAALAVGVERRPEPRPDSLESRLGRGRMMFARAKLAHRAKPTLDDYRMREHSALSGVQLGLYGTLRNATEPKSLIDPKEEADLANILAEDIADLAEARKGIAKLQQEESEREQLRGSTIEESRERVKQATKRMGGFGEGKDGSSDDKTPNSEPPAGGTPTPPSGGHGENPAPTAEEAALRASSINRVPAKSFKPKAVPNP